jgi:cytoskeletal protein CcmA (bactofilin family)
MQKGQQTIVIDPVAMNIVNRIAANSNAIGSLEFSGGVIIEGYFTGTLIVNDGPLVLMQGGIISGDIHCQQDAYLFGAIASKEDGEQSILEAGGVVYMAETLEARADITAAVVKTFEGAQVDGRIRTVRN